MPDTPSHFNAEANAALYLLHCLVQRLEVLHPGLTLDMLEGAKADCAAVAAQGIDDPCVAPTFAETIKRLELIHAQNQMSGPQG